MTTPRLSPRMLARDFSIRCNSSGTAAPRTEALGPQSTCTVRRKPAQRLSLRLRVCFGRVAVRSCECQRMPGAAARFSPAGQVPSCN
jgi:hypothetical protein